MAQAWKENVEPSGGRRPPVTRPGGHELSHAQSSSSRPPRADRRAGAPWSASRRTPFGHTVRIARPADWDKGGLLVTAFGDTLFRAWLREIWDRFQMDRSRGRASVLATRETQNV